MAALAQPGFASQQEVYAALIRQGASPQQAATLAAITRPESSGFTAANNGTYLGLFQIGNYHGFDNNRLLSDDIDYQAGAALQVLKEQGYGAWETYTNGSYQKYLTPQNSAALPPQGDLANFSDIPTNSLNAQQRLSLGLPLDNFNRAALGQPLLPLNAPPTPIDAPTDIVNPTSAPDSIATAIDEPGQGNTPISGPGEAGSAIGSPEGFDLSISPSGA